MVTDTEDSVDILNIYYSTFLPETLLVLNKINNMQIHGKNYENYKHVQAKIRVLRVHKIYVRPDSEQITLKC